MQGFAWADTSGVTTSLDTWVLTPWRCTKRWQQPCFCNVWAPACWSNLRWERSASLCFMHMENGTCKAWARQGPGATSPEKSAIYCCMNFASRSTSGLGVRLPSHCSTRPFFFLYLASYVLIPPKCNTATGMRINIASKKHQHADTTLTKHHWNA